MRTSLLLLLGSASGLLGVKPGLESRFTANQFLCGSKTLPPSAINDDYCDCTDGSDEPGTSACANGRFWCANEGFFGGYLNSSMVRDGVCDHAVCCDGSDEAAGACPNVYVHL